MKIHQLTAEEAFKSLRSDVHGLTQVEAERRLREFGHNILEQVKKRSPWLRFLKGFTQFFAVILWVAAGLAFGAQFINHDNGTAVLGFAIIGVIVINNVFAFWQEYRAERALAALQKLMPQEVVVIRENNSRLITVEEVVPGDVIVLKQGDTVAADCRLFEVTGLRMTDACLTGESQPHSRNSEPSLEAEMLHSKNILLAGTAVVAGEGKALVFATGSHTQFSAIAHLTQLTKQSVSPLQCEIQQLSRWIAVLALLVGLLFFGIGEAIGLSFWQNFIFAIGIIVANVPEGLLPTVTLSLAMASQRMAKRNALVRHLPAVEALGAATVICTDKTGTLTKNEMTVTTAWLGNEIFDITDEQALSRSMTAYPKVFEAALYCEDVTTVEVQQHTRLRGDPMEVALVDFARRGIPHKKGKRLHEIAFDSNRKRLTVVHSSDAGPVVYVKGAPEVMVQLCRFALDGTFTVTLDDSRRTAISQRSEQLAKRGLRVLAVAYRCLGEPYEADELENDLVLVGLLGLEDPPRPQVPAAIAKCHSAGIRVIMLTGDHPATAVAIAQQVGLTEKRGRLEVLTGDDVKKLSDTQLQLALDHHNIFARVTPDQKMRVVAALKRKGAIVAVTGDGVNDAPALRHADIGVAMGLTGTDVARESADIILLDDNFATIVAAIEEGRTVFSNIRKFLTYILTSNVPQLVPYLAFVLFRIPLPLTVIQILAVDLGTDLVPALGLGAERPRPEVMLVPPRRQGHDRLINLNLLLRAYVWLGAMESVAAISAFFFVLQEGGWHRGQSLPGDNGLYLQGTTACLTAIIVMQIANVFLCRSRTKSIQACGFLNNRWLILGIAVELMIILVIVYTPWGHYVFKTSGISLAVWTFIVPFAGIMILLEELRKAIVRHLSRPETSTSGLAFPHFRRS